MSAELAVIEPPSLQVNWRKPLALAYGVILVAFGGFGAWAAIAQIESAAIASGLVVAESNKKSVQHLEGGIVREILARDGMPVIENDVLVRLDDTAARANLETIRNQHAVARAQEARLVTERDGKEQIVFPPEVLARKSDLMVERTIEDQIASFRQRRTLLKSQIDVLLARIQQAEQDKRALANDAVALRSQIATVDQELPGLKYLLEKQLVQVTRVTTLDRERYRLAGALDRSVSDLAKADQSIAETRLQIIQTEQTFSQQVALDIIDVRKNLSDLTERERVAEDVLSRVVIRAPRSGVVQALKLFTIGAVVRPGDTILEIAPTGEELVLSVQISPADMDTVEIGARAEIRFPTFHSRRVPFMFGQLRSVSYDRVQDPQNAQNVYFQGEVVADKRSVPSEIRDNLRPGLPADVIIRTGSQTPLDYLVAPLLDRIGRSMREK